MMSRIKEKIKEQGYLLADGATGTNLFDMGLESGYPPELWNIEHPDRVESNHQSFLEAGSDILLTNSFGANEFRLSLHGDEDKADQINYEAAQIAKKSIEKSTKEVLSLIHI